MQADQPDGKQLEECEDEMLLSVAHTHRASRSVVMELQFFAQAECGKIDDDFRSHSTALICTRICCSTMVGMFH